MSDHILLTFYVPHFLPSATPPLQGSQPHPLVGSTGEPTSSGSRLYDPGPEGGNSRCRWERWESWLKIVPNELAQNSGILGIWINACSWWFFSHKRLFFGPFYHDLLQKLQVSICVLEGFGTRAIIFWLVTTCCCSFSKHAFWTELHLQNEAAWRLVLTAWIAWKCPPCRFLSQVQTYQFYSLLAESQTCHMKIYSTFCYVFMYEYIKYYVNVYMYASTPNGILYSGYPNLNFRTSFLFDHSHNSHVVAGKTFLYITHIYIYIRSACSTTSPHLQGLPF